MNQQSQSSCTENTFVSVIIPVYNAHEDIQVCLAALSCQTYPRNLTEIIVVDNGSDDSEVIENVTNYYDNVIYTLETKIGSYAARNRGIAIARGEIIAFTDADCIPYHDWLEKGIENLQAQPNIALLAGNIQLFFQKSQPQTAIELYEYIIGFPQKQHLEQEHYGVTANLFTRKQIIKQIGLFDEQLKSCGDMEWGQKVYHSGYQQIYAENVMVKHPARHSFGEFYRKTVRVAGGIYDLSSGKYSVQQKSKFLIKSIFNNLIPPLNFAIATYYDNRLNSVFSKVKVVIILYLRRLIIVWELCQLIVGKTSSR